MPDDVWPEVGRLEVPRVTTRSRLYSLPPIGVGTWAAESLSSYVARLAQAHAVTLPALLRWEVYPRMEPRRSLRHWALNGSGRMARKAIAALEDLTGRQDLRYLTFVPWARVLDATPMLRRDRAWCSSCYTEWQGGGTVIYEPLLWTLRVVQRCRWHDAPLTTQCLFPECQARSSPLSARSRPGHCGACGRSLIGTTTSSMSSAPSHLDTAEGIASLFIEHAMDTADSVAVQWTRPMVGWGAWETLARRLWGLKEGER